MAELTQEQVTKVIPQRSVAISLRQLMREILHDPDMPRELRLSARKMAKKLTVEISQ